MPMQNSSYALLIQSISILIFTVVVIAILKLINRELLIRRGKFSNDQNRLPYVKKSVLTKTELGFFNRLVAIYPEYLIFSQVQLSQFIKVNTKKDAIGWLNRINRLSSDFLICDRNSDVLVALELDDRTHELEHRKITDKKKDEALKSADIKIIRVKVSDTHTDQELRQIIGIL